MHRHAQQHTQQWQLKREIAFEDSLVDISEQLEVIMNANPRFLASDWQPVVDAATTHNIFLLIYRCSATGNTRYTLRTSNQIGDGIPKDHFDRVSGGRGLKLRVLRPHRRDADYLTSIGWI